jgi:hypothetical protein
MNTGQVIQSIAAAATLALAIVAFWQIQIAKRQVTASEEAASAASDSAKAAKESVREASRGRTEARAPSVICLLETPLWPPLLDVNRRSMPYANELRLLDQLSIQRSRLVGQDEEFVFSQDADSFLWFRCQGLLINEGVSSARVRLDGEARFIASSSPFASAHTELPIPAQVGTYVPESGLFAEYVLRPRQEAVFEWAAGHTLSEWADAHSRPNPPNPNSALFFSVTVFDHFEEGVTDWIFIVTAGRPLQPIAGRNASWRLAPKGCMASMAYRNVRHYMADKLDPPVPPWAATYSPTSE